jgi:serine/threonine-protein kinase RsbW
MSAEFRADARLENLARFRGFIEEACRKHGADRSACYDLKTAVDEACTNIILHGYAGREPGVIALHFDCRQGEMSVTIRDSGRRFEPEELATPDVASDWQERAPGGLGWFLIRKLVDHCRYLPGDGQENRLLLVKRLSPPGPAARERST